jgi:hypothetical protein
MSLVFQVVGKSPLGGAPHREPPHVRLGLRLQQEGLDKPTLAFLLSDGSMFPENMVLMGGVPGRC